MTPAPAKPAEDRGAIRSPDFRWCLAASLALHGLLLIAARGLPAPAVSPVEVDLTMTGPYLGTGPAKLGAPKALIPGAKGIPKPADEPLPAPTPPKARQPQAPKDWTLPAPGAKVVKTVPPPTAAAPGGKPGGEPATPGGAAGGTGTSPLLGGRGAGADYGTPNGRGDGGMPLLQPPELLNRDEIMAKIRKYYPERERRAGHEGDVLLAVHISVDGSVVASEVMASAGDDFDAAAQRIATLMNFSPAIGLSGQPVAVKIKAPIQFRLKDD